MDSKLSINSSNEVSRGLGLQIFHEKRISKETLMKEKSRRVNINKNSPIFQLRRVMRS